MAAAKGATSRGGGVHTVPKPGGGWKNTLNGDTVSNHQKKANAVERGRDEAKERRTEHTIHNKDGKIGEKNSYGNDPNPPKDKD